LRQSLPLRPFFFDCLYLEDRAILDHSSAERVALLAETVLETLVIQRRVTAQESEADGILEGRARRGP
jgi:ATP-dependent DNA ligase